MLRFQLVGQALRNHTSYTTHDSSAIRASGALVFACERATGAPAPPSVPCSRFPDIRFLQERATGIEPACSAWEADALPLSYARVAAVGNPVRMMVRNWSYCRFVEVT